jgi:hypothetical protein
MQVFTEHAETTPLALMMKNSVPVNVPLDFIKVQKIIKCYALLRMRPLSIPCAECSVVISCGKVDYDKSS